MADTPDEKRQSHTKPVQRHGSVPRLPHERDESSDSQETEAPRPLIQKAHADLEAGRMDTDRGTPMNDTYQRQKENPDATRTPRVSGPKKP